MLLVLASVTESLADFVTRVIGDIGLAGVFVLSLMGSACIPIPSEVVMLFAGFNVDLGKYSLFAATTAGVLGNVAGSWITYAVGYCGRLELVERHGNKLHISPARLARVERWFHRWGAITVLAGRIVPVARAFVSLPAGVARMNFWSFTLLTAAGSIPWCLGLAFAGKEAQHNWVKWKNALHYVDYVVLAAIVIGVVWLIVKRVRGGSDAPPPPTNDRDQTPAADLAA